jgi:trans-aconitate methyltransferase
MEAFVPSDTFEVIVFNESLYYSSRPLALIKKYRKHLSAKGVLIISMVEQHAHTAKIMKAIAKKCRVIEYKKISNERVSWHCIILAAK